MAELTAAQRKKVPTSQLGRSSMRDGGGKAARGGYPMPDRSHAANAKARAQQQYKKGRISKAVRDQIFAKANRILYGDEAASKLKED